jgi:hypothetical protein
VVPSRWLKRSALDTILKAHHCVFGAMAGYEREGLSVVSENMTCSWVRTRRVGTYSTLIVVSRGIR